MVNLLGLLAATYLAAVADTAAAPALEVYDVAPSFLTLAAIVWAVAAAPSAWRVVQLGALGLVFDLNSGGHAGVGMAGFAAVAFVIGIWRTPLRRLGVVEQAVVSAAVATALLLFVGAGNWLFGAAVPPLRFVVLHAIGSGVYTAATSLPAWMILAWLRDARRMGPAVRGT